MPNQPRLVWTICQLCKRPFRTRAYDLKRGAKYCGVGCRNLAPKNMPNQTGSNNNNWRGGRTQHWKGYIYAYAPEHPRAHNGYVLEHILVAEKKLGRFLTPGETVHHLNEIKWSNEPDNLEIFNSAADHTRHHWEIGTYGKEVVNT